MHMSRLTPIQLAGLDAEYLSYMNFDQNQVTIESG